MKDTLKNTLEVDVKNDNNLAFNQDGFKLWLYKIYVVDGRSEYAYLLEDITNGVSFYGTDYTTPACWDESSAVSGILGYLSCQPGDVDDEYFESYTPKQLEWAKSFRAEELGYIVNDMEN